MRKWKIRFIASVAAALLLPGAAAGAGDHPSGVQKITFEEIGQFNDGGMAVTVLVVRERAYVCEFDNGLEILDIRDPARIVKLGRIWDTEQSRGIEIVGDVAYVCCNVNGLKLFDIADPAAPVYLGEYGERDGDPHQFLARDDIAYLTEWHGGMDIIDLSDPLKPKRSSQYKDGGPAFSVELVGSLAFVTEYRPV